MSSTDKGESSARREQILNVAAQIFSEQGVMRTTVRDIATACGILSGSLYHHFASKDEIVDSIVTSSWRDLIASIEPIVAEEKDPGALVKRLIDVNLRVAMRNRRAVIILQQDWHYLAESFAHIEEFRQQVDGIWIDALRRGVEAGVFHKDLDPVVVYHSILGSLNWIHTWYKPDGPLSIDQISDMQVNIFFRGLLVDQPGSRP
jgi:TetR/AcrR family transcriptional regulator, cholesterol catabolism regulator